MKTTIEEYWVILNQRLQPIRYFRDEARAKAAHRRLRPETKQRTMVAQYIIEVE